MEREKVKEILQIISVIINAIIVYLEDYESKKTE